MKSAQPKPDEELHMSGAEFNKIMRKALQVAPAQSPPPKAPAKATKKRKPAKKVREK